MGFRISYPGSRGACNPNSFTIWPIRADPGGTGARPQTSRTALSLCREATPRKRSPGAATGWKTHAPAEDPLARRNHAHPDGTKRADRTARALDPRTQGPSSAVPRHPRTGRESAGLGRACPGSRRRRCDARPSIAHSQAGREASPGECSGGLGSAHRIEGRGCSEPVWDFWTGR